MLQPPTLTRKPGNLTPAHVYFGRDKAIRAERARIKHITIEYRRLQHRKLAA
jgi:putative transposase